MTFPSQAELEAGLEPFAKMAARYEYNTMHVLGWTSPSGDDVFVWPADFRRAASLLDRIRAGGGGEEVAAINADLLDLARKNLATMEETVRRCVRWGKSTGELDMAVVQTRIAIRKAGGAPIDAILAEHIADVGNMVAEPVAWRVKDFADGWILCQTEVQARREAEGAGNLVQPLYATPPGVAVLVAALAQLDGVEKVCPVRSGRRSVERCPRCFATKGGHCGLSVSAEGEVVRAARALADALEARAGGKGAE